MTQPSVRTWLTLYCLAHAGGSAQSYGRLEAVVPPGVRVVPLELPGHGTRLRESLLGEMEQVVTEAVRLLRQDREEQGGGDGHDRPFALFGHSFGALVAYETARRLRQAGATVELLLVSGRISPAWPPPHEPLHMLPDPLFTAELSRMGGIPDALLSAPTVLQLFLPSVRADLRMLETYAHRHTEPLDVPVAAFAGLEDALTHTDGMKAWSELTSEALDLALLPGGHFFLDQPQFREVFADRLARIAPSSVRAATDG